MMIRSLFIFVVTFSFACSSANKQEDIDEPSKGNNTSSTSKQSTHPNLTQPDSIVIVNDCVTADYKAILMENTMLDSNAFELIVEHNITERSFNQTLDLPRSRAKIVECYEDYIIVSFPCGMSCSAEKFIPLDKLDRSKGIKTYAFTNRTFMAYGILTYIKDEQFDTQRIRQLKNDLEITINIDECLQSGYIPCILDTIYLKNKNTMILVYPQSNKKQLTYEVDISKLLD